MALIQLKRVPKRVHENLRLRAARNGRSVEAEALEIIAAAVVDEDVMRRVEKVQAWVDEIYAGKKPKRQVEALIAERRRAARRGE
jgi:plasmid stability protein